MTLYDQSTFASRLRFRGRLAFQSALRIGAQRSLAVDESDLPVLRDATGLPYIPGSSLKGALRSHVESVARALQARPEVRDRNLACMSVGQPPNRPQDDPAPHVCLYPSEVTALKRAPPDQWRQPGKLPPGLANRLPPPAEIAAEVDRRGEGALVDRMLRELSCWTCRLFGAQWLASKVLIKDLALVPETFVRTEVRDGVSIDRDAGRSATGLLYGFEVVPAGAAFELELLAENCSEAELGLLWLGIGALERGEILMGGARSRGLGWCRLEPAWAASEYVTADNLLDALLPPAVEIAAAPDLSGQPRQWLSALRQAVAGGAPTGGNDA